MKRPDYGVTPASPADEPASPVEIAESHLAPYAARASRSRGRVHPEPPPRFRTEYQRDRDRIVHSTAFRRLVYKTQVFVNHEGDLYRTRITHSLEVAQIGRTIARALGLNETLTEAISLAHDLGHTPFGHAGQDALNECMRPYGGFEHNFQSLRVVDELEEHYAQFPGLNLTYECREGILKHCSAANARTLGPLGERFLRREQPGMEAQVADLADAIAYNNHDIDDGLRAGLITIDELRATRLFHRQHEAVLRQYGSLAGRRLVNEVVRRMIDAVVADLVTQTTRNVRAAAPADIDDVRRQPQRLVAFSEEVAGEHLELKQFLREQVYRHYRVLRMTSKARTVVRELFDALLQDLDLLPPEHRQSAQKLRESLGEAGPARAVADYIAGMTDRYAILEHRRLFEPGERT
jgi:dGTPase